MRISDWSSDVCSSDFMGAEPTLIVPPQFFHGQPAEPLQIGALDLAEIDGRVERGTAVMQQVGAGETVFAGETVDQYFGGRHAQGAIIERITAAGGAAEMEVRRCRKSIVRGRRG